MLRHRRPRRRVARRRRRASRLRRRRRPPRRRSGEFASCASWPTNSCAAKPTRRVAAAVDHPGGRRARRVAGHSVGTCRLRGSRPAAARAHRRCVVRHPHGGDDRAARCSAPLGVGRAHAAMVVPPRRSGRSRHPGSPRRRRSRADSRSAAARRPSLSKLSSRCWPSRPRRTGSTAPSAPLSIGTLGDDIDAATLPASSHHDGATTLTVGIDFATLSPARLELPDGEHVLVAGPARSGRSTALIRLVAGWRSAHPDGLVVVCCPRGHVARRRLGAVGESPSRSSPTTKRRSSSAVETAHRRVLVVVDDAERVVDVDGLLAALVAERASRCHRDGGRTAGLVADDVWALDRGRAP